MPVVVRGTSAKVVFFLALQQRRTLPYLATALGSWTWWCRRYNVTLYVLDQPVVPLQDVHEHWQRYHVHAVLEKTGISYDEVVMVDADTVVRWDAVIFGALEPVLGVVPRSPSLPFAKLSIPAYQHLFPAVTLTNYFNAGVMLATPHQVGFFQEVLAYQYEHRTALAAIAATGVGVDQTCLNFLVTRARLPVRFLPSELNHASFDNQAVDSGQIWHFHRAYNKAAAITQFWKKVASNYVI